MRGRSREGAKQERGRSVSRVGVGQVQGRNRAREELSRVKQSRAERGQELGRNWGGTRNVQDRSLQGAGQEYGRGGAEAGAGEEQRAGKTMTMTTMTMIMNTGH